VFGVTLAQVFGGPQYNFTAGQVGLIGLSSWVFGMIANVCGAPACDYIARAMTKRNGGVYEPEFRLVLMIPAVIIGSMGWAIENNDTWIIPVILYGLTGMGGVFLAIPVYTYVVDSHRALAPEAFVTVMSRNSHLTARSTFSRIRLTFAFTFFVNDWMASAGVKQVFVVIGGINLIVCSPALILCIPFKI
jgi:hypothetical protein